MLLFKHKHKHYSHSAYVLVTREGWLLKQRAVTVQRLRLEKFYPLR
jgi:hypothetical protein